MSTKAIREALKELVDVCGVMGTRPQAVDAALAEVEAIEKAEKERLRLADGIAEAARLIKGCAETK